MVEAQDRPVAADNADPNKHDYSHRLTGWAALFFCSTVALAAQVSDTWDDMRNTDDNFVIAVMAISVGLSLFSVLGYAVGRDNFAGGPIEGLFAVICQLFWLIGMIIIMDPDRDIAVSKGFTTSTFIRNANIYFFSWGSTIAIVYVLGKYALQIVAERQNDSEPTLRRLPPKTNLWYLLTLTSLVVLVDSVELFRAYTCPGEDEDLCLATKYAISLGTVGTFFSFGYSVMATLGKMRNCIEFVGALVMFAFYLTGVGLITFNDGPGTSLGNLYFAAWLGCSVTAVLLSRTYMDLVQNFGRKKETPQPTKPPAEDNVEFPDIEMGSDKKDNDDDDGEPSWAKEDTDIEVEPSASVPPPPKKNSRETTEESIEMRLEEVEEEVEFKPKEDATEPIKDDSTDSNKESTKKSMNEEEAMKSNKEVSSESEQEDEPIQKQTKSKKVDSSDSEKEDATTTTTKPVKQTTPKKRDSISDSEKEQDSKSDKSEEKEEVKSKATPAPKKRNSSKTAATKRNSGKAKATSKRPSVAKTEQAKAEEDIDDGKLDQSEKEEKEPTTEKSSHNEIEASDQNEEEKENDST